MNGMESTVVKNYRRELIHEHKALCKWEVNHVFMLRASKDSKLCDGTEEIVATHHMRMSLKKVTLFHSSNDLHEIQLTTLFML